MARDALERLAPQGLAVSIVSVAELYEGCLGRADPQRWLSTYRAFLAPFPILGLTDTVVERFGRERYRPRRLGLLVPDLDLMIAATTMELDLSLLTRNLRHFTSERFPGLRIYRPTEAAQL
jgi:tRNA(fMet)-specific endonuclease VapC